MLLSRRRFFPVTAAAAVTPAWAQAPHARPLALPATTVSLNGIWQFRLDKDTVWRDVAVPHTWQTEQANADYLGVAWYRRQFPVGADWAGRIVEVEFEAVFHTAEVTVNGQPAARHVGKGYTAFRADITALLRGPMSEIVVRVDNSFNDDMLPRGASYDWTPDGGIYRPVQLLITPPTAVEYILVDAIPSADFSSAEVTVRAGIRSKAAVPVTLTLFDEATGEMAGEVQEQAAGAGIHQFKAIRLRKPKLWHFDHPALYRAVVTAGDHVASSTFGVRRFEVRGAQFVLNGEVVRVHGVERMAGSNPQFGMAEPLEWIDHDHRDMLNLNCIFTRVHWPQDQRVLEFCDRHGMLMQLEVPSWGPKTFEGMPEQPSPAIMKNGLEQLRELIAQNYNHPSVITWGLCNEIDGQRPAQKIFVRRMREEARRLDPHRLLTYASHSLFKNPGNDVAGELDFIEFNEYYGSWQKGNADDLRKNMLELVKAFPNKPIVISEYGYCACTADRPEGDRERIDVLSSQEKVLRDFPQVAGLIFFDYNDYRTHMGDKGMGVLKQRIHGVVDVLGALKPSYEVLRQESGPIASLAVEGRSIVLKTRDTIPSYTLRGYVIRWTVYGNGNIPLEQGEIPLPDLKPGVSHNAQFTAKCTDQQRLRVDVLRPTGFISATVWK